MTNDKLLTELRRIEAELLGGKEPSAYISLQNLILEVEGEIRAECNKENGRGSVYKAAERILKRASRNPRECLHKAYKKADKGLFICDNFCCVRFNLDTAPSLIEHPERYDYPDLGRIIDGSKGNDVPVRLPNLGELRAYIKTEKARLKAAKKKEPGVRLVVTDDYGTEIHLNAEYLLDMLEALPGATVTASKRNTAISAVYFKAKNGDGVLLPLRPPKE